MAIAVVAYPCSGNFNEDRFDGGLTETHCSGYLHLPHITQVFRQETHCLCMCRRVESYSKEDMKEGEEEIHAVRRK